MAREYEAALLRGLQPHMTLEEVCELFRISRKTLDRLIKKHGLQLIKIKGTALTRIPKSEVLKLIEFLGDR